MTPEHRAGCEFRVAGRTLSGVAMRFGDVSPDFRERFVPGAFGTVPATIPVNLQHDSSIIVAERALLTDSPRELRVRADLPEGSAALALVRRGVLRSFSIEFHAKSERREAGVRVVERAELTGLALVDAGAYPGATAEVRARSGRRLRSKIPYDKSLACECIAQRGPGSGGECIPEARFSKMAGEAMAEQMDRAFAQLERDVLVVAGDFKRPLGSVSRGTVRAVSTDEALEIEVDLPAGAIGDEIVAAHEAAGVVVRPLIDFDRSEFTDTDKGREYSRPHLRALLVGATDTKAGWPDPTIDNVLDDGPKTTAQKIAALSKISKRRQRLWL